MQIYRKKNTEFVNFVTYLTLFLYICPYLSRKRGDYEATESGIELVRSCVDKFGIGASYMFVCGFAVLEIAVLPIGKTVGIGHLRLAEADGFGERADGAFAALSCICVRTHEHYYITKRYPTFSGSSCNATERSPERRRKYHSSVAR